MGQNTTKVMMLGEIGVGKTSLVRRLVFDTFDATYKATIGVDIYSYSLTKQQAQTDTDIELLIWDVDGDLGAAIFNHIYFKGAGGACIVSDATRSGTHKTALGLAEGFEQNLPGRPAMMLVNKVDLLMGEAAPPHIAGPAVGMDTIWTSAASGHQVSSAFHTLARRCSVYGFQS